VRALALAKAKKGVVTVSFRFATTLQYPLHVWAFVAANRVYTGTTGRQYVLRVT